MNERQDGPQGGSEEMTVDASALEGLVELVRLFSAVIDERPLDPAQVVVQHDGVQGPHVIVPAYLVPLAQDVAALFKREDPGPLRPSEVASSLLELAGLIGDLWPSAPDLELPALEELFSRLGLPITRPESS